MSTSYPFTHQPQASPETVVESLGRHGVVHLPHFIGAETLPKVIEEFFGLLNSSEPFIDKRPNYAAGQQRLFNLHDLAGSGNYPEILALLTSNWASRVADLYLGTPNHLNCHAMVHHDLPRPEKGITEVHYDRMSTLKFFFYLKDTDVGDGAFACVPGSQDYSRQLRSFYERRARPVRELPNFQLPEGLGEPQHIVGPGGTLIVFTTDTYHRGGFVEEGRERYVLRGHTYGKEITSYSPRVFSPQWWREFPLHPRRLFYRVLDPLTGSQPPVMR